MKEGKGRILILVELLMHEVGAKGSLVLEAIFLRLTKVENSRVREMMNEWLLMHQVQHYLLTKGKIKAAREQRVEWSRARTM